MRRLILVALATSASPAFADPTPGPFEYQGTPLPKECFVTPSSPLTAYTSPVFTPDGRGLLTGGPGIHLWDPTTRKLLRTFGPPPFIQRPGPTTSVWSIALSADGRYVVADDQKSLDLSLWEVATGKLLQKFRGHTNMMRLDLSPDGKFLISASGDHTVRLWDTQTGREVRRLRKYVPGKEDCEQALFSPDGKAVAMRTSYEGVQILDPLTDKERCRPERDHIHHRVYCMAFSPDGRTLAGVVPDKAHPLRIWDAATGSTVARIAVPKCFFCNDPSVGSIAYSPDGRLLLAASPTDETVRLFEVATGQEVERWHLRGPWVAFSPDGRTLAAARTGNDGSLAIWEWGRRYGAAAEAPGPRWLPPAEAARRWDDLAGTDAVAAHRAALDLIAHPGPAVAILAASLAPVPPVEPDRLRRLIDGLSADRFPERERATAELRRLGGAAREALQEAAERSRSAEARRRAQALLDRLREQLSAERLRCARAVAVLEYLGTPDALGLLRRLAAGAPGARETDQAEAALRRLERRERIADGLNP